MSTDQTPAMARAARECFRAGAENAARELGLETPVQWSDLTADDKEHVRIQARAAVSAALHDPDDPDWLMNVIADVPLRQGSIPQCEAVILADAVRAAILGSDQ